jgi:hypothetical protein
MGMRTEEGNGSGGREGVSPTLGNGRIPWVLVDNKSAAEIGKKCLPLGLPVASFGAVQVGREVADRGDPSP